MNVSKDTDDRGESLQMSIYPLDHSSQMTKAHCLEFDAEPGLEVGDKTSSSSTFESSLEAALLSNLVTPARGKREQSAAKSNNASVPEYQWWAHLLEDGLGVWSNFSKTQLLKKVDWFRTHMLRRWKRNVFRSFCWNLHQLNPEFEVMTSILKKLVGDRSPLSSDAMLPDVYSWSEEGLGEKTMFRHWWLRRWSSMGQELSIGEDVVGRWS
jgi:hypothetical protein